MFDVTNEIANLWLDISNFILIVGAFLVAVGTFGAIKFAGVKEKFSDERIAVLTVQSDTLRRKTAEAQLALERIKAPRRLSSDQAEELVKSMAPFEGQLVSVGALPLTFEGGSLATDIVRALVAAKVNASFNEATAEAQVGAAHGVVVAFVTGNIKGAAFASAFSAFLKNRCGIESSAAGGLIESLVASEEKSDPSVRNSNINSWVVIAVGDKL